MSGQQTGDASLGRTRALHVCVWIVVGIARSHYSVEMKYGAGIILLWIATGFIWSPAMDATEDYTEEMGAVRFVMKEIPGGTFMAGCGLEDEPCSNEERIDKSAGKSQREVVVAPFYMAETEMTWSVYQQCIDAGACLNSDGVGGDNGWGKGDRPVIEVSWDEVTQVFIPWLNEKTGRNYRLPTEDEWEYAARAGTITRFSWGNEIDCSFARYGFHVDQCGKSPGTLPVKSFAPNAFGLYDMHGNVWEFVQDCWDDTCQEIVLRGGSWLNEPMYLASAARYRHDRTYRESGDGFRLAHDIE